MQSSSVAHKMNALFVVGVLVLLLDSCTSNPLAGHHLFKRNENDVYKVCGERLSDMMARVCRGRYAQIKRSDEEETNMDEDSKVGAGDIDPFNIFRLNYPGDGYYRRSRRAGIVDECCKNTCNFATLLSYCG